MSSITTRSKARSRQTLESVASPRASPPLGTSAHHLDVSQQSSEGVERGVTELGGHRFTSSGESFERSSGSTRKCRRDCLCCPDLLKSLEFSSSVTGRIFNCVNISLSEINISLSEINCKLQNYIYLLTRKSCGVQYVGESIVPLNLRMNIHRKGKSGCEISINHYTNVCPNSSFWIQILEKLPGDGYKNGAKEKAIY